MKWFAAVIVALVAVSARAGEPELIKTLSKYRGYVIHDVIEIDSVTPGENFGFPNTTVVGDPNYHFSIRNVLLKKPPKIGEQAVLLTMDKETEKPVILWAIIDGSAYPAVEISRRRP